MEGNSPRASTSQHPIIKQRLAAQIRSQRIKTALTSLRVLVDVMMLMLAFWLGYAARQSLPFLAIPESQPSFTEYIPTMVLHVTLIIFTFYISRLYHQPRAVSRIDYARNIVGAVTTGAVMAFGLQELFFKNSALEIDYPRGIFFYAWILSAFLTVLGRQLHHVLQTRILRRGVARDNLLIIGTGRVAREITKRIGSTPDLGYHIIGVVSDKIKPKGQLVGYPILGLYADIPAIIDNYKIEQVIIALPDAKRTELVEIVTLCQRGRVDIKVYPDIFAYMAGDMSIGDLGGVPLLTVRDIAYRGWRLSLKRGMDFIVSLLGLIFLSPFILLIALLIRLESKGSPFYAQVRMGLDGKPFPVIKFRSMRQDAEAAGVGWTVKDDPRVTRMGKIMRKTEMDELPQLINVLLGQMSLVGPRPERPHYVRQFQEQIPRYMERHREKAGMTGWAQVNGLRGDTSITERTSYDLWYVENWSLWLDIKIIIRTVWMVIRRSNENAY